MEQVPFQNEKNMAQSLALLQKKTLDIDCVFCFFQLIHQAAVQEIRRKKGGEGANACVITQRAIYPSQ